MIVAVGDGFQHFGLCLVCGLSWLPFTPGNFLSYGSADF